MEKLNIHQLKGYNKGKLGIKVKLNDDGLREMYDIEQDNQYLQGVFCIQFVDYENNTVQLQSCENHHWTLEEIELNWIELLLLPLSSLTKEIEVKGKKFVPFLELYKKASFDIYKYDYDLKEPHGIYEEENNFGLIVYHKHDNQRDGFSLSLPTSYSNRFEFELSLNNENIKNSKCNVNQLELIEKLYEWHFDLHGLIEKGLAIDVTTLTDNPYL